MPMSLHVGAELRTVLAVEIYFLPKDPTQMLRGPIQRDCPTTSTQQKKKQLLQSAMTVD